MNNNLDKSNKYIDDQISLNDILEILWNGKRLIMLSITLVSIIGLIYSLSLPNIYKSVALLSPVEDQSDMTSAMRNYGGLANIAGINLSSQIGVNNSTKALDKLNSLSFFEEYILPNIFLPDLMAIKSWNPKTNSISYNKNDFDFKNQLWIRDFRYPQTQIPSSQESFKVFKEKHLDFFEDKNTGFVTISIEHQSPHIAKEWTELVIKEINHFFRVKDKQDAQRASDYLNDQIAQTSFAEIKEVIAQLLQQKTQKLTLIEVSDFYVFEYIDPPAVMEEKYKPHRAFILILSALLGLILGIFIVLFRNYFTKKQP